jgi:hypothetical protein
LDRDRSLAHSQLKQERLQDDLDRKKADLEHSRGEFDRERASLLEKIEGMKKKLAEAQDEGMRIRLEGGREQALSK